MDQDVLVATIGDHIQALQSVFDWTIIIAIGLCVSAFGKEREVEVAGMTFTRGHALLAASVLYLVAIVALLALTLRLNAVLKLLDEEHFLEGYSALAVYPWILSPYSFLGVSSAGQLAAPWGIGAQIAAWWISATSIALLYRDRPRSSTLLLPFAVYVSGILYLIATWSTYRLIFSRLKTSPDVLAGLEQTAFGRWAAIWVLTAVGIAFCVLTVSRSFTALKRRSQSRR